MAQNSKYVGDRTHILGKNSLVEYNRVYSNLHNVVLKFFPKK